MSEIYIKSIKEPGVKKWTEISFRTPMSSQRFEDKLPFPRYQQRAVAKFLETMDGYSCRARAYRRQKDEKKLKIVNKNAKKELQRYGKRLFKILTNIQSVKVKTFEDMFGESLNPIVLNLDDETRRFPWELAFDGQDFLCTKYGVGRTWIVQKEVEYLSGHPPLSKKALVVGLDYKWLDKEQRLDTPSKEARQVKGRLEKLGIQHYCFETRKQQKIELWMPFQNTFRFFTSLVTENLSKISLKEKGADCFFITMRS